VAIVCSVCSSCIFLNYIYHLICCHRFSGQEGSIFSAAGDACAYCWDVVCILHIGVLNKLERKTIVPLSH
jgi:hypothetical protein